MLRFVVLGVLTLAIAATASAMPFSTDRMCRTEYIWHFIPHEICSAPKFATRTVAAPEIDPASAIAGLTLMLGGLAVLRGQRNTSANR
jgi:hypothetical protein